jgi:hypothetical protein
VAILVELVFPAAMTIEVIDAVTDEMDVDTRLPAGAILHVHYEKDGRVHGVDVWESAEAFQKFVESTCSRPWARSPPHTASTCHKQASPRCR